MTVTFESAFNTTLAQSLKSDGTDTEITLSALPSTITSGVMKIGTGTNSEWVYFGTVDAGSVEIRTCVRGLDKDATSSTDVTASNKKDHAVGATVRLVAHSLSLNSKANLDTDNTHTAGKTTFTSTAEAQLQLQNVTTTQRDLLTGVENGDTIYNTTLGQTQWYEGGTWVTNAVGGTVADGSTTVAGKFEEATVAEQGTAAATGGTGARLLVANANLVKASSGAGDENKIAILSADGKFADGFQNITEANATTLTDGSDADSLHTHASFRFGGDGSDGDLTVSTDTTLNPTYGIFNYDNLTIDATKTLSFGANFQDKVIHIKVKGDCTINGTLSLQGAGSVGGAGSAGAGDSGGSNATSGSDNSDILDASNHYGTGGAWDSRGDQGAGGTAGAIFITTGIGSIYATQDRKLIYVVPGAGGGGGSGGSVLTNSGNGAGGAGGTIIAAAVAGTAGSDSSGNAGCGGGGGGGAGGGALILEVKGDLTFGASSTIDLSGQDGADGGDGGNTTSSGNDVAGNGGSGGGGGSGGMGVVLYNGTLTDGGVTIDISSGAGGDGGDSGTATAASGGTSWQSNGGGASAGGYAAAGANGATGAGASANGSNGSNGSGASGGACANDSNPTPTGGTGGTAVTTSGTYILQKNTEFA